MKTSILSIVALLLLSTTSAFAQFASSPIEPGYHDYLRSRKGTAVQVVTDTKMLVNGVTAEWVSQNQVTLSAVVVELKGTNDEAREMIASEIANYNVSSAVGTLSVENGVVRMTHFVNPRFVS